MSDPRNPFNKPLKTGLFGAVEDIFGAPPKTLAETIADIMNAAPPKQQQTDPTYNALGTLIGSMGLISPAPRAFAFGLPPAQPTTMPPLSVTPPVRRKIFFSFHYEDDIRRSCIVRKSYMFRPGTKPPSASFYDRSLWEKSRRESDDSLKRLIREGMVGSSVTCILAGTSTWSRPWVRFEIAHSLFKGNGLFTCFIHNVKDPQHGVAAPGYDPLWFIGLELRSDGKGNVVEWIDGEWQYFSKMKLPVPWPAWMSKPPVGQLFRISDFTTARDYNIDDGFNNLCRWAQDAARTARRL